MPMPILTLATFLFILCGQLVTGRPGGYLLTEKTPLFQSYKEMNDLKSPCKGSSGFGLWKFCGKVTGRLQTGRQKSDLSETNRFSTIKNPDVRPRFVFPDSAPHGLFKTNELQGEVDGIRSREDIAKLSMKQRMETIANLHNDLLQEIWKPQEARQFFRDKIILIWLITTTKESEDTTEYRLVDLVNRALVCLSEVYNKIKKAKEELVVAAGKEGALKSLSEDYIKSKVDEALALETRDAFGLIFEINSHLLAEKFGNSNRFWDHTSIVNYKSFD
ncbi:hypothetical protein PCANC_14627 [Puccinia coronata f. sp. avenae]|uniref:Uncharacterized protein n=1 Tax=Puccinia coronata f. sp. avenae TaxID=200324 RepID=A0A2N5SV23_9BASI|nr:hypothetical protein PCANC_14627 [Puccinia coronata f. sp. avenae]